VKLQEIADDYFLLIQFSIETTKVFCVGQVEELVAFTYEVKVMRRLGEGSQFALSDEDNMSEIEREDNVAKIPVPVFFRWDCCTHYNTEML
jgi:hypothetical protein